MDKQADINVQNVDGDTPLHIASQKGNKDIVKMLQDSRHMSHYSDRPSSECRST